MKVGVLEHETKKIFEYFELEFSSCVHDGFGVE